jgi:tripartite-type tricarboxylate transporter receptor subunit TctC
MSDDRIFQQKRLSRSLKCLVLVGTLLLPQMAAADVADFYRKTNITIGVGSGPGGGYDAYARLLARHYGRFIPGNPTVIVQNCPGAGGLKGANNLFNLAPKDGSNIAILQNTLTLNQIAKSNSVAFDMMKFNWLGSMSTTSTICAFTKNAQVEKASDIFAKDVIIGTSSGSTAMIPAILNSLAKTRFQGVKGYDSTNNVLLAMERGEVHGVCGWGWDSAKVQARSYLESNAFKISLDIANAPNPDLKAMGVPFIMDLVKDGEDKSALQLILSTQVYNRPFAAPPGVPVDRLEALRLAFEKTLKDGTFLSEAARGNMDIEYMAPKEIERLLTDAFKAPQSVQARAVEELKQAGWGGL